MGSLIKDSANALVADVKLRGSVIGVGLTTIWTVHVVNTLMFLGGLNAYGIVPRSIDGLWGILFAPLLHGSFSHLISNSIAWCWLGLLVMLRRPRDLIPVTLISGVVGGIGTWLTGAPGSVHIGLSGILFGYLGYLFTRGFFERSIGSIAVSGLSMFFFGSLVWGVMPGAVGISWQGHLFGFIGGILAAWLVKAPAAPKAKRKR